MLCVVLRYVYSLLFFQALFCGPLPGALGRLGSCVAGILRALECPICVSTVRPPAVQCPRGHVLCAPCRAPLAACPICRTALGAAGGPPLRNLLADEVIIHFISTFITHCTHTISSGSRFMGSLTLHKLTPSGHLFYCCYYD